MGYAFVTVRDHRFFKLRVTIPREEMLADGESYLQEVLDILYPAIRMRPPVEVPYIKVTVYRNVFLAPQHESCSIAGWILYGAALKEQIERGNYLNTFEREFAARRRVLE